MSISLLLSMPAVREIILGKVFSLFTFARWSTRENLMISKYSIQYSSSCTTTYILMYSLLCFMDLYVTGKLWYSSVYTQNSLHFKMVFLYGVWFSVITLREEEECTSTSDSLLRLLSALLVMVSTSWEPQGNLNCHCKRIPFSTCTVESIIM